MPFLSTNEIIIASIFLIAITCQILYWSWLWQLKEYRPDRMRAHFQDIGARSAFLALIGYSSLRQLKIPKFTAKVILIFIFSFFVGIAIVFLLIENFAPITIESFVSQTVRQETPLDLNFLFNCLTVGFLIMPTIIFFLINILNFLSAIFKKRTIAKAAAKIAKFPKLKVIGITGSYGKSTTKEILAEILSKKYKVLKTPANINTVIGIAQLILDKLDESYEIFVVEMGAYKIGEIKEICDMARPQIGVITAINEQHLALFGSIERTIKAKFELVESLPKDGLAILNGDGRKMSNDKFPMTNQIQMSNVKIANFGFGENNDLRGYDIITDDNKTKFKVNFKGRYLGEFALKIPGEFNACNALAAILAAREIGMSFEEIFLIIQKNDWSNFSLKFSAGPNNSVLIDDTYNSNPDGVLAALNHIKNQRGIKIVIMSSMIELGGEAHRIHQRIGKEISQITDKLFFLDNYYIDDIRKGAKENKNSVMEIKNEKSIKKIAERLKKELKSGDTALFINRSSRKVLEELKK